jgi:thiamine kinase-like enzyme
MAPQQQSERETHRVIVFGRDGTEILLHHSDAGFSLPSVEIPRWERVAENLAATVKRERGCDAVCLFTPSGCSGDRASNVDRYQVMECWRGGGIEAETVWKPISSLSPNCFLHPEEFKTIQQSLHELEGYQCGPSSPFARRGWLSELRHWTSQIIRAQGLELTESFRQYNAGPTFNLIRFETTGSAVWFKAVGAPNLREFPITVRVAELFPRFMPKILGTKVEWNGWLSREVEGRSLCDTNEVTFWEQAAADLARLQIESISQSESLLHVGAHELRIDSLFSAIEPFFDLVDRLMDEQPKTPPAILSREELSLVRVLVDDALTLLAYLGIPSTLGHLDLNPGNIITSANGCVFLDWAEAYVGHPFFSLEYLLQHFRRAVDSRADSCSQVIEAYKAPWRQRLSDDHISEALAVTPLAAVFAYAASSSIGNEEQKANEPKVAGYFRSLARRMNRETMQLKQRSSCPR